MEDTPDSKTDGLIDGEGMVNLNHHLNRHVHRGLGGVRQFGS